MSISRSLKQTLLDKIIYYLRHDNPPSVHREGCFGDLINSIEEVFNKEGRDCAHAYSDVIRDTDERKLAAIVYNDIRCSKFKDNNLRNRLLEGLCRYFKVAQKPVAPLYVAYPGPGLFPLHYYVSRKAEAERAMMRELREKVTEFARAEQPQLRKRLG